MIFLLIHLFQRILSDPGMRSILEQMSTDPTAAQVFAQSLLPFCITALPTNSFVHPTLNLPVLCSHMKNPEVAKNIQRLLNAGIIQMGSAPRHA